METYRWQPESASLLYQANWGVVVEELAGSRKLTREFVNKWREWLEVLVEDIDAASSPDYRFSVDSGSSPFIFTDSGPHHLLLNGLPEPPSPQQLCPRRRGFKALWVSGTRSHRYSYKLRRLTYSTPSLKHQ